MSIYTMAASLDRRRTQHLLDCTMDAIASRERFHNVDLDDLRDIERVLRKRLAEHTIIAIHDEPEVRDLRIKGGGNLAVLWKRVRDGRMTLAEAGAVLPSRSAEWVEQRYQRWLDRCWVGVVGDAIIKALR